MDLGNDNNYIDFLNTDSGFNYDYGVAAVPEPSSVVLMGFLVRSPWPVTSDRGDDEPQ